MKIDLSRLRELREKEGLSRIELAKKIGCREYTIYRWEEGKTQRPLPIYREALSKFYKTALMKTKTGFYKEALTETE